jgi:hypothetical protein
LTSCLYSNGSQTGRRLPKPTVPTADKSGLNMAELLDEQHRRITHRLNELPLPVEEYRRPDVAPSRAAPIPAAVA